MTLRLLGTNIYICPQDKLLLNNPIIQCCGYNLQLITIWVQNKYSIKVILLPWSYQSYPWLKVFVEPLLLSVLSLSSLILISFPFFLHFFSVWGGQRTRQNSKIQTLQTSFVRRDYHVPWQLMKPSLSESASLTIQSRSFLFIRPFMIFLSSSVVKYPSLSLSKVLRIVISSFQQTFILIQHFNPSYSVSLRRSSKTELLKTIKSIYYLNASIRASMLISVSWCLPIIRRNSLNSIVS